LLTSLLQSICLLEARPHACLQISAEIGKGVQCDHVPEHYNAETNDPALVLFFPWRVCRKGEENPEHEAEDKDAGDEGHGAVPSSEHLLAALRYIFLSVDLFEKSLVFILGQLLPRHA